MRVLYKKRTIGLDTIQFRKDFHDPEIFNTINSHIQTLYHIENALKI